MVRIQRLACLALVLCCASFGRAEVPSEQRPEVEHLLQFVLGSGCTLERNGSRHTSQEAYEHLRKKYNYFRNEIRSAEDFIDKAASRSELTGKPYRVSCGDSRWITSQEWLRRELERYRASRTAPPGERSGHRTK